MRIKYKSLLLNPGHSEPAPLYWGLFTAIVTIVTGLCFLQGNIVQRNFCFCKETWFNEIDRENKSLTSKLLSALSVCSCLCVSRLRLITHWSNRVRIWKHTMERNEPTVSSRTLHEQAHLKMDSGVEKSHKRMVLLCVCESSAFNYPLIKQGWQEGEQRGHFERGHFAKNLQPFQMHHTH